MTTNKTRQIVADEYGICTKTLKKRLAYFDVRLPPGLIFPRFQKLIYERLGYPTGVPKQEYERIDLPTQDEK